MLDQAYMDPLECSPGVLAASAAARCPYRIRYIPRTDHPDGLWAIKDRETFVAVYARRTFALARYTRLRDAWLKEQG